MTKIDDLSKADDKSNTPSQKNLNNPESKMAPIHAEFIPNLIDVAILRTLVRIKAQDSGIYDTAVACSRVCPRPPPPFCPASSVLIRHILTDEHSQLESRSDLRPSRATNHYTVSTRECQHRTILVAHFHTLQSFSNTLAIPTSYNSGELATPRIPG